MCAGKSWVTPRMLLVAQDGVSSYEQVMKRIIHHTPYTSALLVRVHVCVCVCVCVCGCGCGFFSVSVMDQCPGGV